jgi:2-oxoglutarate dehydrogenase E1 component
MFKGLNKLAYTTRGSMLNRVNPNFYNMGLSNKVFCWKLNNDSFINGTSANYIEKMYAEWRRDPSSVHVSWNAYFTNIESGMEPSLAFQTPPTIDKFSPFKLSQDGTSVKPVGSSTIQDSLKVILLIRSFQTYGFLNASLDPLNMKIDTSKYKLFQQRKHLDLKSYGFTDADLDKEFIVHTEGIAGILSETKPLKLKYIIERLEKAYCSSIGVEFIYNHSRELCNFLREKFENEWVNYKPAKEEKIKIYESLSWAVLFEEFLKNKFTTHKRFGLEGLESLILGLRRFIDFAVEQGLEDITLGMPHRGRLNVLANVFRKPLRKIFAEFQGKFDDFKTINQYSGDVKYHLGSHYERIYPSGKKITMDILPNPSHLECVNPVVMGNTRAKQHFQKDTEREKCLSVLLHGDAAFAGQGVVYESMQMSNLEHYTTGGVLHVVCNNQIGFTTTPGDSRSTPFCTDIGKCLEAPIIHVNADDPIAVDFVFKTAAEYTRKFKNDIIIDVIGYRKHGHNELDQPMFTQPLMYQKILNHENVLKIFEKQLITEGYKQEELDSIKNKIKVTLEESYNESLSKPVEENDWKPKPWSEIQHTKYSAPQKTGVNIDTLKEMGEIITHIPQDFNIHPQLKKNYEQRIHSIRDGKNIDWATAESLAWGNLLKDGYTVRLSGQDVERGTFSHRHAVLNDQINGNRYVPLAQLCKNNPDNFQIKNSHLSEFAVLGFELGYSYYNPNCLVMWEAQFGDFANGAQIIIDQFIGSGEAKWNTPSGLTLLLPHGMDGQGPEHSSARLERFLELMDDDYRKIPEVFSSDHVMQIQKTNMQVCNPTFSANYFHLLIRQLKRQFRKPLIIATSKKLLRFKLANSNIEEFGENLRFTQVRQEASSEILSKPENVKKLLICSGQVYYDLIHRREKLERNVK